MRSVLRSGGLLRLWDVVYNFAPQDAEDRLNAWCATGGDGIVGEWSRAELEEHVRDEHSTFTWLLEPMIARAAFQIEEARYPRTASSPGTCSARPELRANGPAAPLGGADDRIDVDHGLTGTDRDRSGLKLALAGCRAGDRLVVIKSAGTPVPSLMPGTSWTS